MSHSCETFVNGVIEALAALEAAGEAKNNRPFVSGVDPSWDDKDGTVTLSYRTEPENLLRLDARVTGRPRWITLNLDLGCGAFEAGDMIGIVAEVDGDADRDLEMFIRSATEHGDVDTELSERLSVSAAGGVVAALHIVGSGDSVADDSRFHRLGIRLPQQDFRLAIRSARVFVRPAADGPATGTMTLAGAAH